MRSISSRAPQQGFGIGAIPFSAPIQLVTMFYNIELFLGLSLIVLSLYNHLSLPITYILIAGLFSIFFPGALSPVLGNSARFAMSNATAQCLLYTVIVLLTPRGSLKFFPLICLLNSLWVIFYPKHYGLGMATSMDSTLIAIMYPMTLYYSLMVFRESDVNGSYLAIKIFYFAMAIILPILAIFIAGGSVGLGGLCLSLFVFYSRPKYYLYLLIPLSLFALKFYLDPLLFNDSLRFVCWRWSMDWWWANANHWFGTGLGTFSILGPYIQVTGNHMPDYLYVEMHNDWLQALFDLGYVGTSVITGSFLYLLYTARAHRHLLASLVTFAACAVFYYPTRNVVLAAFGVAMVKEIIYIN